MCHLYSHIYIIVKILLYTTTIYTHTQHKNTHTHAHILRSTANSNQKSLSHDVQFGVLRGLDWWSFSIYYIYFITLLFVICLLNNSQNTSRKFFCSKIEFSIIDMKKGIKETFSKKENHTHIFNLNTNHKNLEQATIQNKINK